MNESLTVLSVLHNLLYGQWISKSHISDSEYENYIFRHNC